MPNRTSLDFAKFRSEVYAAAKRAFTDVRQNHADETFYAFALYSDDGAMTVCPAANTEQALKRQAEKHGITGAEDFAYFRWGTGEWAYEAEGAHHFDAACTMLRAGLANMPEPTFSKFRESVFEAIVGVLRDLENDGFFGVGPKREGLTVFFAISDSDDSPKWEKQSAKELNPPAAYKRFGEP